LPDFEKTKAEVQAAIDAATWLEKTDLVMLDVFARELTVYRHAADALARLGDVAFNRKLSASKLQLRRVRVLTQLAAQMGFTAQSRYRLGLTQARTERERQGAQPVRTEERALAVARLLNESHALPPVPPVDAEVVEDDDAEPETPPPDLKVATPPRKRKVTRKR
jgi:hypothetical protein